MGQKLGQGILAVTFAVALSGCMSGGPFGAAPDAVTRGQSGGSFAQAQDDRSEANRSQIIDGLIARRTVLPAGSSYATVADAVLAASARPAEAELQQARMRARAADKNWLPSLGPNVSLLSLSSIVASLVVDQVLFDFGRKKAERAFARADVEAAAVALAQDQNDRVHAALELYLTAEAARASAASASAALARMSEMEGVMTRRVEGGISDRSELAVIHAKVAELAATQDTAARQERMARAELAAMSARPLAEVHGIAALDLPGGGIEPLSLNLARAELARDTAEAEIARAGLLPGLSAGVAISSRDGLSGPDLQLSSDSGFGFATPDNLRAVDASQEAAARRLTQAGEDAARRLAALGEERAGQAARAARAGELARQGQANVALFSQQFEGGRRSVSEVVSVIETMARLDAEAIAVTYAGAHTEIEIARRLGVLADGSAI